MKIRLTESQFASLMFEEMLAEYNIADGNAYHNPYAKKFKHYKELLEKLVDTYGSRMININNGKEYDVYEIYSLSELLGVRYCLSRLIRDGEPYGQVAVKPLALFKPKNY